MPGQIEINNKKTYDDFKFKITNLEISQPSPKLNLIELPYMNGVYDFSNVTGETKFDTREINVEFEYDNEQYFISDSSLIYYNFINFLYSMSSMDYFKIDYIYGLFNGRVCSISSLDLFEETYKITVNIIAQPFRKCESFVGDDNLETMYLDYAYFQNYSFTICNENYKEINIYNPSISKETPTIKVKGNITIKFKGIEYTFTEGEVTNVIRFDIGDNDIQIKGYGEIEFIFYKEMI